MIRGCSWVTVAALLYVGATATAQGPGGFGPREFGPGGGGHVVTGEPFTDQSTSSSFEKLADGTTITHSDTYAEARDSQGRTVETVTNTASGSGASFTRTTVMDPVAHTLTSWSSQSKTAMVVNLPPFNGGRGGNWGGPGSGGAGGPGPGGRGGPGSGGPGAGGPGSGGPGPDGGRGRFHEQVTRETLAGKMIAGVYATGVKTTMTVPAGAEGNDKPLVSVHELWTSSDLKIVLLETSDSPREGFHKMEVTSLTAGEPDATLFQVPSGYIVKTETRHGRGF